MAPLSHPYIQDGWFREISSQWPGQALNLRVNRILHVQQSLHRNVLVFESETYGNVLVVDGVIQCTERDEFAYHEMIAHLPLAGHPNPKKVLIIGGGDGGVVREVLKHDAVEQVVMCDIDEAVFHISKSYFPHASTSFTSPKVVVHIGDGVKFLAQNEGGYDVIISTSFYPVSSSTFAFRKPYFQLLHNALAPEGIVVTYAGSLWLHLDFMQSLRKMALEVFPVSEYAYTTVPTLRSGEVGFLICVKAPGKALRTQLREVKDTKFYNKMIHASAFDLPEFAKVALEEGKDIRPKFGRNLLESSQAKPEKKILLLGSGFVARPCAEYIARGPFNKLTIACRTLKSAESLAAGLHGATAISLDVNNKTALEAAVARHDLVISLIPYTYHATVIEAAIKGKTHVVTTSYISPAIRALDKAAREAGIVVMNEIGLDPGIDHLYALKTIEEVHSKGGKIKEFYSYCCGIPAPQNCDNPLGYKFSWSSRGSLLTLLNQTSFYEKGQKITISGDRLMDHAQPYYITPAFAFVAYPNRDSTPFREYYRIPEAETVVRGSLRYQGFPQFVKALVSLGWLDATEKEWLTPDLTWAEAMQKAICAPDAKESTLTERIKEICKFPSEAEANRIISGLRWIGLLSSTPLLPRGKNLLDTLCAQLETLMAYGPGERDLVMLQHKFVIKWADGTTETRTSTLEKYGAPSGQGHSAMALTVGIPCGIATQLVLDDILSEPGVHAPYTKEICDPIRELLEKEGIGLIEKIL